jgi:hypothetical protein
LKFANTLQQLNKKAHDFSHWDELPFFFSTRRKIPISRFARDIGAFFVVSYFKRKARAFKGKTSRILREEFPWLKSKISSLRESNLERSASYGQGKNAIFCF